MSEVSAAPWRVLPFSVATYDGALFALARAVPALDSLLCRLEELHDPILYPDRVLRNHQRDLALHGGFALPIYDAGVTLRSGRAVMLEDRSVFFGVQGRRDIILVAARVGYAHSLCSVVLPLHRIVINIRGPDWNIGATAAERALALFAAAGLDWSDPPAADPPAQTIVTGDVNYAHHVWNQLGALESALAQGARVPVLCTHQPIAPLAEIFDDYTDLAVASIRPGELPALDPRRVLPFAVGGRVVARSVRERVRRVAERHATRGVRDFVARAEAESRKLIWLTLRLRTRTAINLLDALLAIGEELLRDERFALVIDGFSRPNDYAGNPDYDRAMIDSTIRRERALANGFVAELAARLGTAVAGRILIAVGCDLLDSIFVAARCAAYFAHHGTVQHKVGYFTTIPGLVHSNPGVLAADPIGRHRYVTEDIGAVEYIESALVDDIPAAGGQRMDSRNNYRFNDIPRLVTQFRAFLGRQGVLEG